MQEIIKIIGDNSDAFISGLVVTLKICGFVWSIGLLLGLLFAIIAYKFPIPFYYFFSGITLLLIAIPFLVILYWFHYPFQKLINQNIDPFITATLTLSLLNSFLVYQLLVESFRAFPLQFVNAAKVCGLTSNQVIFKIQIPLIFRQFIPGYMTLQIFMLQSSIFSSLISVQEIFRKAQQINAIAQKPIEIYSAMAIFFVIICLPVYIVAFVLRKKYSRDLSEA